MYYQRSPRWLESLWRWQLRWHWWSSWLRSWSSRKYFLLSKVSVKILNGSEHIGASSFSIFLGAKSEDLTRWGICRTVEQRKGKHWRCTTKNSYRSPWFVWIAVTSSIVPFLSALALYKILKARWWESRQPVTHIMSPNGTEQLCFPKPFFTTGHISTGFWAQTQHPGWKARQTEWERFFNILSRSPVLSPTFSQYCRQLDLSRNDIFWICGRCNDGRPLHLHHLLLDPGSGDFVILIRICWF